VHGEVCVERLLSAAGWTACLVLVTVAAREGADLTWRAWGHGAVGAGLAPAPAVVSADAAGVDVASVASLRLFGGSEAPAPAPAAPPPPTGPAQRLTLQGVFLSDDPARTRAYIAAEDGSQGVYRVGEPLPGGARLVEIHAGFVVTLRGGARQTLRLDRETVAAVAAPTVRSAAAATRPVIVDNRANRRIARDLGDWQQRLRAQPEALLGLLAVTPVTDGSGMKGFRLQPGAEAGLLRRLGLSPGDVVVNVNGTPLDSLERGIEALQGLATARDITLEVARGGKALVFQYRVGS
jgi:general secretion pathway protein C